MNDRQKRAISKTIGEVEHDLRLARMTKERGPQAWKSIFQTVDEYILQCEKEIEELKENVSD